MTIRYTAVCIKTFNERIIVRLSCATWFWKRRKDLWRICNFNLREGLIVASETGQHNQVHSSHYCHFCTDRAHLTPSWPNLVQYISVTSHWCFRYCILWPSSFPFLMTLDLISITWFSGSLDFWNFTEGIWRPHRLVSFQYIIHRHFRYQNIPVERRIRNIITKKLHFFCPLPLMYQWISHKLGRDSLTQWSISAQKFCDSAVMIKVYGTHKISPFSSLVSPGGLSKM